MLAAVVPLAALPFASVHPQTRGLVGAVVLVVGGLALVRGLSRRHLEPSAGLAAGLLVAAGLLGVLPLILTLSPERVFAPELAGPVMASIELSGVESRPLALDPHRGLMEWGLSLSWVVYALGTALVVRNSRRGRKVLRLVLGAGLMVVVLALLHRLAGAESIYGSGVPAFARDPFLGPFINPNHGGVFCAALVPLALVELSRDKGPWRWYGGASLALLALGIVLSGSRGAVLACLAALVPMALIQFGRRAWIGLAVLLGAGGLALVLLGPVEALRALSEAVAPSSLMEGQDVFTGRGPMYEDALRLATASPWLGVGPHGFDDGFEVLKSSPDFTYTAHAHQEVLQLLAEHGLPITLLWLSGLGLVLLRGLRAAVGLERDDRRRQLLAWSGVLVALATASLFTFPLRIGALEALGSLALGAVLGLSQSSERGRRGPAPMVLAGGLALAAGVGLGLPWASSSSDSVYGSHELSLRRADVALEAGRVDEAIAQLERTLARKPVERQALQRLSPALLRRAEIPEALHALEVAALVEPTSPWVWRDLARLQRRMGDYDLARASWRRALWCDVPDASREPLVREALKGPGEARHIAELALPERGDVLSIAGRVVEEQGEQDLAEELLRRAADRDPRYGAHLAAALLRWSRPAEALAALEGVDGCFALESRAQALTELERLDEAEQAWLTALDRCKDEPARLRRIRLGLARLRLARDDDRGRELLLRMLAEEPADGAAWRSLMRDARDDRNRPLLMEALRGLRDNGLASARELELLRKLEAGYPLDDLL
jgi:O-antigen ligase/tetratricopeptide (TPR) repeat protein